MATRFDGRDSDIIAAGDFEVDHALRRMAKAARQSGFNEYVDALSALSDPEVRDAIIFGCEE